jgi:hypothetical protein
MAGTSTPTIHEIAESIAAAVEQAAAVAGVVIPPEVVHDRRRLILTRAGLTLHGYDQSRGAIHYWEVDVAAATETELEAREHFVDQIEFAVRGVFSFADSDDATEASTVTWRNIIGAVRDSLRRNDQIMGAPMTASRGTRITANDIVEMVDIGIVHLVEIRLTVESEAEIQ